MPDFAFSTSIATIISHLLCTPDCGLHLLSLRANVFFPKRETTAASKTRESPSQQPLHAIPARDSSGLTGAAAWRILAKNGAETTGTSSLSPSEFFSSLRARPRQRQNARKPF